MSHSNSLAAVAVLVLLLQHPVAGEQVGVVLAEQPEPVADQPERLGAVLVAGADAADVAREHQAPALAQGPGGAHADDRVDPVLVLFRRAPGVDAEVGQVELALQLGVEVGVPQAGVGIDRDRQRPGARVRQLPGADPVGAGQGLDQHLGGGVDLQPVLGRGRVVLQVGVDRVGDQPEAALAQLGLEHQRAVEVVPDVLEAGVDVGVDPADADVPPSGPSPRGRASG